MPNRVYSKAKERVTTFTGVLLMVCTQELKLLPSPSEEAESMKHMLSFIAHLFLQQLLSPNVIGQVIRDLIGTRPGNTLPQEPAVKCVIEMLNLVGPTLDQHRQGEIMVSFFAAPYRDTWKCFFFHFWVRYFLRNS